MGNPPSHLQTWLQTHPKTEAEAEVPPGGAEPLQRGGEREGADGLQDPVEGAVRGKASDLRTGLEVSRFGKAGNKNT